MNANAAVRGSLVQYADLKLLRTVLRIIISFGQLHLINALRTHPLILLMHSHHEPNCALTPILIPEPAPHVKLFLTSTRIIPPYNSLRIRPPPEPPPRSTIPSSTEAVHLAPLP